MWALILWVACAAGPSPEGERPVMGARIVPGQEGPDTLVATASWALPADDGRGPLDSLRVVLHGIRLDSSEVYRPPFPVTRTWRVPIPSAAYVGAAPGGATYTVFVTVTTYRRALNAVPLRSNEVPITLLDTAPPSVTGLHVEARKVP